MDQGWCASALLFRIEEGDFDGVDLAGRMAVEVIDFPGPTMFDGNGTVRVYVDEGATDEQCAAIETILHGKRGGGQQILQSLASTFLPTVKASFAVEEENGTIKATVGDIGEIRSSRLKNEAGEVMTMQNTGFVMAFQFDKQTAELAPSDGTRWSDPDMPHQFDSKSGAVGTFTWTGE